MAPNEVSLDNSSKIRQRIYGDLPKAKCSGLKSGDKVRSRDPWTKTIIFLMNHFDDP